MEEISIPPSSEINIRQPESTDRSIAKKEYINLLICSFILGLLFNFLFYGKPPGLSYPLFILALYSVLLWNMQKNQQLKQLNWNRTWLPGIPVIALSFCYLIFSNPVFAVLNFLLIPVLFIAHTLLLTSRNRYQWFEARFSGDILYGMFIRPFADWLKPFSFLAKIAPKVADPGKYKVIYKILAGLLVAVPLVLIIVPLLASADDIFRQFIAMIPNIFLDINIGEFIARLLIVIIVACLVFSYLWSLFVSKSVFNSALSDTNGLGNSVSFLDPVTVITILVLLDSLYALFIAIQFSYLFGSLKYGLPPNFTYAQYARKGFFELVMVTLINLIVLLGNMNFVKLSGNRADKGVKLLNTALVLSTLIILLSAHVRMSLYEEAYGFTYLRVLTHAFMGYLFVLFAVTLWKIWRPGFHLLKSYLVISIIAYTLLNYLNIDSVIVKNNIQRYNNGHSIDIMNLSSLSYDAVPPLVDFVYGTGDPELAQKLQNGLINKKRSLKNETAWQSFNISRFRASKVLSPH